MKAIGLVAKLGEERSVFVGRCDDGSYVIQGRTAGKRMKAIRLSGEGMAAVTMLYRRLQEISTKEKVTP